MAIDLSTQVVRHNLKSPPACSLLPTETIENNKNVIRGLGNKPIASPGSSHLHWSSQDDSDDSNPNISGNKSKRKYVLFDDEKIKIAKRIYSNGGTAKEISNLTGVSIRSAQNFQRSMDENGYFRPLKRGRKETQENDQIKGEIRRMIETNRSITQSEIIEKLPQHLRRSKSTICRIIKSLDYSRKRIIKIRNKQNSSRIVNKRKMFVQSLINRPNTDFIYIDELNFNRRVVRSYGYVPSGSIPTYNIPTSDIKECNISVMVAISTSGLLAYEIIDGAYHSTLMEAFLFVKMKNLLGKSQVVIMDKCRFHLNDNIRRFFQENGIELKFAPPYSPQLNPIEELFAMVKSRYQRIRTRPNNADKSKLAIEQIMQEVSKYSMKSFYTNMRQSMVEALQSDQSF